MKFITYSALRREHGFSARLITKLLGEPDAKERNPIRPSGAEMRLYKERRVIEAKKSVAWKDYQTERIKRSERSRRVNKKKERETVEWAKKVEIRWTNAPQDTQSEKNTHKLSVANLRHQYTTYETVLTCLSGRVGRKLAYKIIKKRCLNMIAERYPELAEECKKQATQ